MKQFIEQAKFCVYPNTVEVRAMGSCLNLNLTFNICTLVCVEDLYVTPYRPYRSLPRVVTYNFASHWVVGKNGARAGTKQDFLGVSPRVFGQRDKTAHWSLHPDIDWYFEIIGCGD